MSDTPRTKRAMVGIGFPFPQPFVPAEVAEQLERELAEEKEKNKDLLSIVRRLVAFANDDQEYQVEHWLEKYSAITTEARRIVEGIK